MKLNDIETLLVAEAVKKVTSQKETEVLGKGDQDFIDLHTIDKKKRLGTEPLTEKDVEEANEFTKAAAKAAVAGDKEFDFDGKTYPVEMDKEVAKKIIGEEDLEEGLLSKNDKTSGYAGRGQFELKKHIMPLVKKNRALKDIYFDGPDLVGDTKKGKQTTIAKGVLSDKNMTVADLEKAIKSFKESVEVEKKTEEVEESVDGRTKEFKEKIKNLEYSKDVDESTAEYAKSLEKIANDRKMKNISKKDRETLSKIADLLKRANEAIGKNEEVELDEMFELDRKGSTATYGFLSKDDLSKFEKIAKKHGLKPNRLSKPEEKKVGGKKYFTMTYTGKVDKLLAANKEGNKVIRGLKEYVGPALTPANQIAKKHGGKVKAIMVKDDKGKKSKYFYVEDEEIEEAIDPRKFALGGNTKATKRDVDAILSKIFMSDKLAKQVEGSAAYKAGFKSKGKGKNPYKKDTADFHLFILGQQSAQAS